MPIKKVVYERRVGKNLVGPMLEELFSIAEQQKISKRDLAEKIGVGEREIYRWINKENYPKSLVIAQRIGNVFLELKTKNKK